MLNYIILGYCIYFLINIYVTIIQIIYVKKAKEQDAVILAPLKFKIAGNYSIESQKLSLATAFYDFILFFFWIGYGLVMLDNATNTFNGWQKAVIFIDSLIIIKWILT